MALLRYYSSFCGGAAVNLDLHNFRQSPCEAAKHATRKYKIMKKYIYTLLALLSFLYYLWLGFHNSFRMSVLPFWIILSALFLLLGYLHRLTLYHKIPAFMKRVLKICFCACLIFFLFVESCIVWGISRDTGENLDYILVLGAGLNGDKPSAVLEMRLEKARLYLQEHPQTVVIVSGGQGPTEPVSEAESMKNWLVEKGIPDSRIIMEDKSTTTAENIRYSFTLMDMEASVQKPLNIGIATSNFHVFRSLCIARHIGKESFPSGHCYRIYGLPASFPPLLLPHYMVREFFTICVDALLGNLG